MAGYGAFRIMLGSAQNHGRLSPWESLAFAMVGDSVRCLRLAEDAETLCFESSWLLTHGANYIQWLGLSTELMRKLTIKETNVGLRRLGNVDN